MGILRLQGAPVFGPQTSQGTPESGVQAEAPSQRQAPLLMGSFRRCPPVPRSCQRFPHTPLCTAKKGGAVVRGCTQPVPLPHSTAEVLEEKEGRLWDEEEEDMGTRGMEEDVSVYPEGRCHLEWEEGQSFVREVHDPVGVE